MSVPRQNPNKLSRRCSVVLGLAPVEVSVVVAVIACERAERGYPCKQAILDIVEGGEDRLPSQLVTKGWLEQAGKAGKRALYRATVHAYAVLGFETPTSHQSLEKATAAE